MTTDEITLYSTNDLVERMRTLPQLDMPVNEYLDPITKTYTRELFIPKGTLAVGRVHKKACMNIITKGVLVVKQSLVDPGETYRVPDKQNLIFTTQPGSQKIVYAIEDTIILNIFTDIQTQDIKNIEEELIQKEVPNEIPSI